MKDKYKELLVARYYVEHVKSVDVAAEEKLNLLITFF